MGAGPRVLFRSGRGGTPAEVGGHRAVVGRERTGGVRSGACAAAEPGVRAEDVVDLRLAAVGEGEVGQIALVCDQLIPRYFEPRVHGPEVVRRGQGIK